MALWNPNGEINLIDLDNEYYLVRFANEDDFQKVLSGGPWVIYGSYLTVQPWKRHFNSAEEHPSHIMVWVRLPNLPYRYYTKSLFRYIAMSIGDVVKVDYNTSEGKRGRFVRLDIIVELNKPLVSGIVIDGRRQDIEYEGLPTICFKCGKYGHATEFYGVTETATTGVERVSESRKPDDLHGPWMQVTNRRRRNANVHGVVGRVSGASTTKEGMGSRFQLLASDTMEEDATITEQQQVGDVRGRHVELREEGLTSRDRGQGNQDNNGSVEVVRWSGPMESRISLGVVNEAGTTSANKNVSMEVTAGRVESGGVVNEVASLEKVTMARSNLNAEKHRVVLVGNTDESHIPRITKGRVLPNSMRGSSVKPGSRFQLGVKGGASTSMAIKKVAERGLSKADASGRLSKLVSDLDKAVVEEETRVTLSQRAAAVDEIRVAWQTNSVFEQPSESVRKGALDPGFNRSFKLLVKKQKPDMVVVMEPRISGRAADTFIRKSGFEYSYRVEAHGFSGGIWLLWQCPVNVQILAVSNQYIHTLCKMGDDDSSFFGAFVYASPNAMRQRSLWGHILALDPGHLERRGGSKRRFGVCSLFLEFLFDSGLIDMGYNGPQFTWRRGNLFQRLDRCLCSSRWQQVFPWSEVQHLLTLGSDHRPILPNTKRINTHSGARPFRYLSVWNDHPDFHKFLQSVWDGEKHFGENVSAFQSSSKVWNREVFGSLDKRKDILMRRLRGIERALEVHYRPSLVRLEAKLKRELDIVLDQEERFWHQKSRAEWITQGDRNTSYCHMVASARHKHNVIRMLRIDGGVWCDEQDNRLAFSCTLLSSPRPARVADMVTNDGLWDWDRIGSSLPRIALDRIASVPPPRTRLGGDFPVWRWEDKRGFTTRSAYAFLVLDSGTHYPTVWRRIWKLVVPQRVRVFVWVTLHERLLTNAERVRRHFENSELCGICGGAREDMEHVLRSCAMAKGLWLRLIPSASRVSFFSLTFKEWFCTNLFEGSFVSNDDEWSNRFAIMCWLLWKRRCRLLFEENMGVLDDVLVTGNRLLMQTRDAFTMLAGSYARSAARKALGLRWANMSAEEKKRYIEMSEEQKQAEAEWISKCEPKEVVKKEEVKKEKSSRCSLKKLSNTFKELQKVKTENVVKELGFSSLIGISPRAIHRDLCRELAEKFDVECSMMEYSGHKISVMVEDVQAVLAGDNMRCFEGGIPSRGYASSDGCARMHAWGKKDIAKIVTSLKGERLGKKFKVLGSDEECSEGKEGGRTDGGDDIIIEMLGKVIAKLGGIKESLEAHVKKDNEIENKLETLKEESKKVVDQVAGLSANMMFMKKPLQVIDAKFAIGLKEGEVMMEKTDVERSNREYEANIVDEALKEDVILLKEDNVGVGGRKSEIVLDFGHTYMTVADADTLRPGIGLVQWLLMLLGGPLLLKIVEWKVKKREGFYHVD
ncbi:hypothetical protein GQ457_06G017320 [Hibiscus cannabinus]